jgi:dGTPase
MEWHQLLCSKRLGQESAAVEASNQRTRFDSDIDRITFAGAFRRLSRKTQVHPFAPNDHVHTRLTHSLEVAQVGKSLGKSLGARIAGDLPPHMSSHDLGSIVQAACLAHDIGNPPFGHAGESAISDWFASNGAQLFQSLDGDVQRDVSSFEGNAQGFRVLAQTENHLFEGGLRLTYATLGAFLKYPWTSRTGRAKFSAFIAEEALLARVAEQLGLKQTGPQEWCRHPLAFLVEAADDICYATIDLEDAVELGILEFDEVAELLLGGLERAERVRVKASFAPPREFRVNLARLRGPVFGALVASAIEGFMNGYDAIMQGSFSGDLFDLVEDGDPRRSLVRNAKALARRTVYSDSQQVEVEEWSAATFGALLSHFCAAALDSARQFHRPEPGPGLTWQSKWVMDLMGKDAPSDSNAPPSNWTEYQCLRRVLDYVSGMTDNYAISVAKRLQDLAAGGHSA